MTKLNGHGGTATALGGGAGWGNGGARLVRHHLRAGITAVQRL
ncbi:MAG: hypothetical protein ACJ79K_15940 [Gemmatimonadaceae bacterium]